MAVSIQVPRTATQLDEVRTLFRSFVAWHRRRHKQDIDLIDRYFDADAFEEELAGLPGRYAPPDGQLLLATRDGTPVGCVALRRIDAASCEMKRMFVYESFQGTGVGRALAEAVVEAARGLGYRRMRLDTSVRQEEAKGLYQRLGFHFIEPYGKVPEAMQGWLVFMERVL